eukprot:6203880-Pleurochrysis_carterae.AAC.1
MPEVLMASPMRRRCARYVRAKRHAHILCREIAVWRRSGAPRYSCRPGPGPPVRRGPRDQLRPLPPPPQAAQRKQLADAARRRVSRQSEKTGGCEP